MAAAYARFYDRLTRAFSELSFMIENGADDKNIVDYFSHEETVISFYGQEDILQIMQEFLDI